MKTETSEDCIEIKVAKHISKARNLLKFVHDSHPLGDDDHHVGEVVQKVMDTLALAHKDFYKLLNKHREEN